MMKKTNLMRKLYNSKVFWAIVSLVVSFGIWVYVTSVDGDEYTQLFYGVRVELVGEDSLRETRNMVITDLDTSTVSVRIKGPRRIVASLDSADITARIDVSKLTQAAYTTQQYTIDYATGVNSRDLVVESRAPETVSFTVSKQTTKTVPVRGGFEGDIAEGYTAETPVFEPATITLTGAEAYIKDVEYAWVTFGKDVVADSTYSVETGFTLMNADGEPCSTTEFNYSTNTVTATLPMLEIKEVLLGVDVVEGAGATKSNVKIKVEPESLTLAGDSAILSGINRIILDTVDLTDFSSTYSETYTIPITNGLRNLTGITEAKVTIEVIGLETRTFKVRSLSCINEAEGTAAEIISESIDVTLRGTAEQLDKVKSENIRAVADLADYKGSTGSYMPSVRIYVDGVTEVGAIGENTISVEIRRTQ